MNRITSAITLPPPHKDKLGLEKSVGVRYTLSPQSSAPHTSSSLKPSKISAVWDSLMSESLAQHCPAKHVIFIEGTHSECMYVLIRGTVKIWVKGKLDEPRVLRILSTAGTPHFLDLLSFTQSAHSVSCESMTPCQIAIIEHAHCRRTLREDTECHSKMLSLMANELEYFRTKLRLERECSARERVAHLLLELKQAEELASTDKTKTVLSIHRKEFVELTGIARETVARILSEFSRKKWVHLKKNQIILLNQDKIAELITLPNFSQTSG